MAWPLAGISPTSLNRAFGLSPADNTNGLVWWMGGLPSFADGSGHNVKTLFAGTVTPSLTPFGLGIQNTGVAGNHLNLTLGTLLAVPNITCSAWVNPASIAATNGIVGNSANGCIFFWANGTTGKLVMKCGSVNVLTGTTGLQVGVWQHVACTYDGSHAIIYINGVQDSAATSAQTITASPGFVGAQTPTGGGFNGQYADVRLY